MSRSRGAIFLSASWFILEATNPTPSQTQPALLPPTAGGWTRADTVELYPGNDLYLLIDGGADLFLEYGFEKVLTSDYAQASLASATVELYEMKGPAAAYGLFTAFTAGTGTAVKIGQEAVLGLGYCIFWKGNHVGMLTAATSDSSTGPMLLELAEGLEKEIRHSGRMPYLCVLLRNAGFDSRLMVYVRGRLALRNQLPQAWATSFPPTDGVTGTSGGCRYLILEYPDSATAFTALGTAADSWKSGQLGALVDSSGRWTIHHDDGKVTIVEQHGRHVLAVSGAEGETIAVELSLKQILVKS